MNYKIMFPIVGVIAALLISIACGGGSTGQVNSLSNALAQTTSISGTVDLSGFQTNNKPRNAGETLAPTGYYLVSLEGEILQYYTTTSSSYSFSGVPSNINFIIRATINNGSQVEAISPQISVESPNSQSISLDTTVAILLIKKRNGNQLNQVSNINSLRSQTLDEISTSSSNLMSAVKTIVKSNILAGFQINPETAFTRDALLAISPLSVNEVDQFLLPIVTSESPVVTNPSSSNSEIEYLAIDISGGTNATSYPVTTITTVPDMKTSGNENYKSNVILLRKIKAGSFAMGSPEGELGRRSFNEMQHNVTLTQDYYMAVFELTWAQYQKITGWPTYSISENEGAYKPIEIGWLDARGGNTKNFYDAFNFMAANDARTLATFDANLSVCGILSKKSGLLFDLPTEAQWEYACRAGTTTALNNNRNLESLDQDSSADEVGRYWYNSEGVTNPFYIPYIENNQIYNYTNALTASVGSYLKNQWGLYDMHGNLDEWTRDWYQANLSNLNIDPIGAVRGDGVVIKGGSVLSGVDRYRNLLNSHSGRIGDDGPDGYGFGTGEIRSAYRQRSTPFYSLQIADSYLVEHGIVGEVSYTDTNSRVIFPTGESISISKYGVRLICNK